MMAYRPCRRMPIDARRLAGKVPLRLLTGGEFVAADDGLGSGPVARSPASTGRYAARRGRPIADSASPRQVAGPRDACRPVAAGREQPVSSRLASSSDRVQRPAFLARAVTCSITVRISTALSGAAVGLTQYL